jgi:hypothetical protein
MGVSWLTPTILGDVCGTCRHDGMAVLGSKMSTSGTRGLGLPVGCTSDQARRWSTTDVCIRQAEYRRRLDSGYPRASCRQINTGKCLDPPLTYQHYSRFSGYHTPHKSGLFCSVRQPHPQTIAICLSFTQKGTMIKISAETNGPSTSWQHPVLPFGR